MDSNFEKELSALINKYSQENLSNTPDFILAEYLNSCFTAFNKAVKARDRWYVKDKKEMKVGGTGSDPTPF